MMKKILFILFVFSGIVSKLSAQDTKVAIPNFYYYAYDPATGVTYDCASGCVIDLPICDSLCIYYGNRHDSGPLSFVTDLGVPFAVPNGQSNCHYFVPTALGTTQIGFFGGGTFIATWTINVVKGDCCPSNVIITGNYTQSLTESQDWIKTNATTIIPVGANVKLDAEPTNGYVELNTGFETQTGSVFIAQALDGCGPGVPMKPKKSNAAQSSTNNSSVKSSDTKSKLIAYPNPATGIINIKHSNTIKELQVFDMMGRMIIKVSTNGGTLTQIDLSKYSNGIYIVQAEGVALQKIVKHNN